MAPSPSSALAVNWRFHRPIRFMAFSTALRSMGLAVPKYAMVSGASARSSKMRSACAETIVPKMLGVPAAYFHGSELYSTRSGKTRPSAIMSPPYRNGREASSRCSLPYSTPTPNGASIL